MHTHTEQLHIARRYRGPPRSGNGGYVCGLVAASLPGAAATVRLHAPPPLETALVLQRDDTGVVRLRADEQLVAEGRASVCDLSAPAPPDPARAAAASKGYAGFHGHTFPECFVCGPARAPGDGLRSFAGPLGDDGTLAAPWTPDASLAGEDGRVRREFLWAALDCSGGFAVLPVADGMTLVLGELCAETTPAPRTGEPCIVLGWPIGRDGRKRHAGSAVYGEDGRLLARARAVWLEVPADLWA